MPILVPGRPESIRIQRLYRWLNYTTEEEKCQGRMAHRAENSAKFGEISSLGGITSFERKKEEKRTENVKFGTHYRNRPSGKNTCPNVKCREKNRQKPAFCRFDSFGKRRSCNLLFGVVIRLNHQNIMTRCEFDHYNAQEETRLSDFARLFVIRMRNNADLL